MRLPCASKEPGPESAACPDIVGLDSFMRRILQSLVAGLCLACAIAPGRAFASRNTKEHKPLEPQQETGFLNRTLELHGATYRFQVYLPEEWRRDDHKQWPIILFLHGRGERGSEGMWQTQIGLPQAVRDHPERWPFVIVMPQCPLANYWTDPEMLAMAMAALDRETEEFHGDPERTYLTGLSLGGYGAWELARLHPRRWAAVAIAAGGIFWSYAPERWQQASTLPAEYARAVGRLPLWLFHGSQDDVVVPRARASCSLKRCRPAAGACGYGSIKDSGTIAGPAPTTSRSCRFGSSRTAPRRRRSRSCRPSPSGF